MKTLALTGVGLGLCGVAALASPLVTLLVAGGRSRPADTGTRLGEPLHATGPARPHEFPAPDRGTPGHPGGTTGPVPFIPAQRTRS
ncbi:hypothetical protein N566_19975 [Streptomycetaceae bacterium MP113-05]|nr:hypothetical protein N566_19975 [Streptomycetaceae bacterium MP113-05]